ncbi:sulfurtransferase TusA family protein [Paenibacillus silvisoli]|uniref:sulfurtransferase TusA family protein n=1 Tax=Paenibacillus silvisoli TaxID=3110539 RepID=UPI0028044271|nr:sulfurtransferase TusA family protein [Paenibacillus silvisoli]
MSNSEIQVDLTLDCIGLACPMPIVKTKKAIETLQVGQVIEVQATDKGSRADIQGWAKNTGHQYLGTIEENELLKHYLRKSSPNELKQEIKYAHTMTTEELQTKLKSEESIMVVDVREPAEYAFHHVPGAISIPIGELENRMSSLDPEKQIAVICRTGNRSDLACQLLEEKGFNKVFNVVTGMSGWSGPVESLS